MGSIVSLSAVIGRSHKEVLNALGKYTELADGGIQEERQNVVDEYRCIITEEYGNTTVMYPDGFLEWDSASKQLSLELDTSVFALHKHEDALWLYILYEKGKRVDEFSPIPSYWDPKITEEEANQLKGDADLVSGCIIGVKPQDVEKYLISWDKVKTKKAYPYDQYGFTSDQMHDFMKAIRVPDPIPAEGVMPSLVYRLWTKNSLMDVS